MGLLDALSSDEAKLGIGLLAAGGYSPTPMSTGQRLQMALAGVNADKQNALKMKLLQSQMAENESQNALRQAQLSQQQKRDAYFMGDGGLGGSPAAPSVPGASAGVGGLPGSPAGAATAAAGGDKFSQWAAQYGIPRDALVNDYLTNGGKGIAEMLMKRGTPDMQVSNGYAYDKNRIGAGYLPQLNISNAGQASLVQVGPDDLPVVSAPRGAVETFGAYKGIEDRSRAANTPGRPTILPGGRMGGQSQLSEITGAPPVVPGMTGRAGPTNASERVMANQVSDTLQADQTRLIEGLKRDLATPGAITDPRDRRNAEQYLAQLQATPSAAPAAGAVQGGGLEFSPAEKAQQAAAQAGQVDTSKADVVRDTAKQTDLKTANKFLGIVSQVENVFKDGPTQSGAGAAYDATAAFFGKTPKGAEAAQRLKALGGWLVANVPRMEGPQSNFDVANYQVMAADVANDKLPLDRRKAALDSIKTMMEGVAGKTPQSGGATGEWDQKPAGKVVDSLPTPNASNKGQRIRDTSTGKILRSNGLQWKEE